MNSEIQRSDQKTTPSTEYRSGQDISLVRFVILSSLAFLIIISAPASAGEQYMAGSPDLTAHLAGTNDSISRVPFNNGFS